MQIQQVNPNRKRKESCSLKTQTITYCVPTLFWSYQQDTKRIPINDFKHIYLLTGTISLTIRCKVETHLI